jgi:uncharacterized membrane protein
VIARFWLTHHQMFEHVRAYNNWLIQLNLGWLLTVVILPFPTEIIGTYESDRFTAGFYVGTILALSIFQTALTLLIRNHPELERPDNPVTERGLIGSLATTGLFVVAFVLAALVPGVNFYALFVLFLTPLVVRLIVRIRR